MCCGAKYDKDDNDAPITGGIWYCRTVGGAVVCGFTAILGVVVVIMLQSEFSDLLTNSDDGCK